MVNKLGTIEPQNCSFHRGREGSPLKCLQMREVRMQSHQRLPEVPQNLGQPGFVRPANEVLDEVQSLHFKPLGYPLVRNNTRLGLVLLIHEGNRLQLHRG